MKHTITLLLAAAFAACASLATASTVPAFSTEGEAFVDLPFIDFEDDGSNPDIFVTATAEVDFLGDVVFASFEILDAVSFNPLFFTETVTSYAFDLGAGEDTLEVLVSDITGERAGDFSRGARIVFSFFEEDIDGGFVAASVDVFATPIPLPASALLLLAGVGALGAMRRRTS
ncbi:MAG: VPLPA-CTERM sorting domain-containing protein [Pseudomonadota bacterium]